LPSPARRFRILCELVFNADPTLVAKPKKFKLDPEVYAKDERLLEKKGEAEKGG
jgi:hypothetical protein